MAFIAKPAETPRWATDGGADVTTPPTGKQDSGWINEKPPRQYFNWLHKWTYLWIAYLENRTDGLIAKYDAIVGSASYASHASLTALMADPGIAAIKSVLIISSETVNATHVLNANDMIFEFKPGVVYSKGSAGTALQVTGLRNKILNGRFTGFNGGSDEAIELTSAAKNNRIIDNLFNDCTTDIQDDGENNSLQGNLVEVP